MKPTEINLSAKLAQTVAIFIVTSIISLFILSKATPIVWEDHFQIGQNLRSTGALTIDDVPSIIRPPGYPGFVAASLWIGDAISAPKDALHKRIVEHDQHIVVLAQGFLLGVLAAALFFWASLWSGFVGAAGLTFAAALNPYSLALANLLSYHLLFVVLLTFSTLGLILLRGCSSSSSLCASGVGVLWGLTSLVKPVALIIPLFVTLLMLIRRPLRPAMKSIVLIGFGMILTVGPYVGRNYLVTGQPFVTAQGGFGFWGSSVEKVHPQEPFIVWQPIWWKYGMPIFSRVTGVNEYSEPLLNAYALQLNAEFWNEARQNITGAPDVYIHNVLRNFISFNLDTMAFWNRFFVAHNKQLVQMLSEFWIVCLMALAAAGVIWGWIENDDDATTVTVIYLGIVISHSISFATELYTVAKLPLIVMGFALLVRRLEVVQRYGFAWARLTAFAAAGLGLLISGLAVA
jgi:hypothetical protein